MAEISGDEFLARIKEAQERRIREAQERQIRERALRVIMTPEARQRLTNVRMVRPEVAKAVEVHIIKQASAGKLQRPISDEELKYILSSISSASKKEFKIRWA